MSTDKLQDRGITAAFSSGLLTATGAETVYDTTVTIQFAIKGKMGTARTAVADGVTETTGNTSAAGITLTANKGRVVVWGVIAAGTVKVEEGPIASLDSAGNFIDAPQFPSIPDAFCPFAYQVIKADSTTVGTWDFGTDNWNATGVTNVIVNVSQLPDRPQIA